MKPTLVVLAALLLISSLASPSLADPVLDTDGNPLKPGVEYYIKPSVTDVAGGTTLVGHNGTCPLFVALTSSPADDGYSVKFFPVDANEDEIDLDEDFNVEVQVDSACLQSTVWRLEFDDVRRRFYVLAGGVIGNSGAWTLSNWFKIRRYEGVYQLAFCPDVCKACRRLACGSLGTFEDGGRQWLGISDVAFPFVFKRA